MRAASLFLAPSPAICSNDETSLGSGDVITFSQVRVSHQAYVPFGKWLLEMHDLFTTEANMVQSTDQFIASVRGTVPQGKRPPTDLWILGPNAGDAAYEDDALLVTGPVGMVFAALAVPVPASAIAVGPLPPSDLLNAEQAAGLYLQYVQGQVSGKQYDIAVGTWTFVGCFVDQATVRALPTRLSTSDRALTVQRCASLATAATLQFFGLQGSSCFGGTSLLQAQVYGAATTAECSTACTGDRTQFCGLVTTTRLLSSVYQLQAR
ncbi:Kremen protein 1 [Tetrabaena socialis]|uniref:Kremen protein 1 n=1 Tax=Tetrabaena socialis TaxID=47790 RepID=A0A2J8AJM7_9CHLO|nr:Kremen protein 1 [Tetrabaena socialis]|eukprot:PNH12711.1 Kremen protein 1 [Tetrabaena socialis]